VNDLSAAETAGFAIAFNPRSDALASAASVVVNSPDLRTILPHLVVQAS
jgi:phosphoserine phosphatase